MRRTVERKFEGMSPRERRKEVLRMQRIERAAQALFAGVDAPDLKYPSSWVKKVVVSRAKLRDLADALGTYDAPTDGAQS